MRWNKAILGTAVGAAAGFLLGRTVKSNHMSPEKALQLVKDKFKAKGPISGSWIYMKPQELSKEGIDYTVYFGGISRLISGESIQYEFYVDSTTGTIIDVVKLDAKPIA